ncbi:MAG: sodium:solute symporter, partial [Prevotella sp.]|nr:sodium:solute symporter [Prevotella sp.]
VGFVWLYTHQGGVKSVIWADTVKTFCLIISVVLCILFIAQDMGFNFTGMLQAIEQDPMSKVFFFDNPNDKQYFFKQFFAGIFTMIATCGLDQDMMQRNLSCKNSRESQKNMVISILLQFVVITAFLMLGVLLYQFAALHGIDSTGDKIFPAIATGGQLPLIVGILFVVGLISSAYNAAGSALTALTTSFTIDILGMKNSGEDQLGATRKRVHIGMALLMALVIIVFNVFNSTSVVDAVYILASYTYGPILGMFAFGILTSYQVRDRFIPYVAILSPLLCFVLDKNSEAWFNGYRFSYELLILNALFTFVGFCLMSQGKKKA